MHSILIPVFNGEKFISKAVESALRQTYSDLEIIVSDNCSTDATADIVAQYSDRRLKVFRQRVNLGMVGNWNFCLSKVQGSTYQVLCADDTLADDFVEKMLNRKSVGEIAFCNARVMSDGAVAIYRNPFHGSEYVGVVPLLRKLHGLPLSSLVFDAQLKEINFSDSLPFNADFEYVFRCMLLRSQNLIFVDEPLVNVLLHEANETKKYNLNAESAKLIRQIKSYTNSPTLRLILNLKLAKLSLNA